MTGYVLSGFQLFDLGFEIIRDIDGQLDIIRGDLLDLALFTEDCYADITRREDIGVAVVIIGDFFADRGLLIRAQIQRYRSLGGSGFFVLVRNDLAVIGRRNSELFPVFLVFQSRKIQRSQRQTILVFIQLFLFAGDPDSGRRYARLYLDAARFIFEFGFQIDFRDRNQLGGDAHIIDGGSEVRITELSAFAVLIDEFLFDGSFLCDLAVYLNGRYLIDLGLGTIDLDLGLREREVGVHSIIGVLKGTGIHDIKFFFERLIDVYHERRG